MTRMGYRHQVKCTCGSTEFIVHVTEGGCSGDDYDIKCAKCGKDGAWWQIEQENQDQRE